MWIKELKKVADSLNIPFSVVGALASDLILEYSYGIKSPRRTEDVDLGVEVATWEPFEVFKDSLITKGEFSDTPKKHRVRFG
jgi:predicted nucleotidyltransferase